ncbi:MAG: Dam family site-specific DNA-(adenine-N6)-methyltransferase [Longicatena sp.]|uniref:Dam family site-specific DNA-(adenine-N6)-methyltransferase n=1 Tax=Anaerorhabdus sp. TaxID=1872524 RepID=UPI002FC989CC
MDKFEIYNRRYLGSKTKLLDFIHQVVSDNCESIDSVFDVFGGTGVVGYSFNKEKSVIINDILMTNYVIYNTFFSNKKINIKRLEKIISEYNKKIVKKENYYSKNFSDTYLSKKNMKKVGYIRDDIDELFKGKKINVREKSILLCSLLYALDKIANTVGHYDAYRMNGDLMQTLLLEMPNLDMDQYNNNNIIYNMDSNEVIKNQYADLVYIDPPYNSRQYCDAYHFLENVVRNEKPEVFGVAKKMDRSNLKSKYCTSKAADEFKNLIDNVKAKYILVSYNNTGEKGNARSNAKISDSEIKEILESKGEVKVFEKEYAQFTTGKTKLEDHKERLFLCIVGKNLSKKKSNNNDIVKSPLNYTGGKYKLMPQLIEKFPNDIEIFFDVFSGGTNVGINVTANKIICIDKCKQLISLCKYLQNQNYYTLVKKLDELIDEFKLSNTYRDGYAYYNCNSSNGVGQYNKDKFTMLKNEYNNSNPKRDDLFLLLIFYSFNNQIRFNKFGNFNLPVGKRDFNASIRKKLRLFMDKLQSKEIIFYNNDFRDISIDVLTTENSFLYLDPPYLLGTASYNENGGWTEADERELLEFLKKCNEKKIKFALSNVIEHKGDTHDLLLAWCLKNRFNITYINCTYSNSNYHIKDKSLETKEVLITNY